MEVPFTLKDKRGAVVLRGYTTKVEDGRYSLDLPRLVPGEYVLDIPPDQALNIVIAEPTRLTGRFVDDELRKEWEKNNAGHRTTFGPAPRRSR